MGGRGVTGRCNIFRFPESIYSSTCHERTPSGPGKVSVHCRWPLVTGTDGQAGDAKYNTPCNTT